MEIILNSKDYFMNKDEIIECLRGEMCKIMRVDDPSVPYPLHYICADVTYGGWMSSSGRKFHVRHLDSETGCKLTGLGTFLLIRDDPLPDGQHRLLFTDDLNPDLP